MTDYYWGPDDASVHFCEKKYEHSEYIGEYYNTWTTFFYIFIGLLFVNSSLSKLGWITIIMGITSMILHATLRYYGQWMDEMSMLLLCFNCTRMIRKNIPTFFIYPLILLYILLNRFFLYFFLVFTLFQFYIGYEGIKHIHKRKRIFIMLYIGFLSVASICWLCDQLLCDYVQEYQLHAWWHLFTALGVGAGLMALK